MWFETYADVVHRHVDMFTDMSITVCIKMCPDKCMVMHTDR